MVDVFDIDEAPGDVLTDLDLTKLPDPFGRSGGPYLDAMQLMMDEVKHAANEGREPDFSPDNLDPSGNFPRAEGVSVEVILAEKDAEIARLNKLLKAKK